MKSYLFKDVHSLGELQGNILRVLETRVRRQLEKEMVEYGVWAESQGLLNRFFPDPLAIDSHSRGQNVWLMNLKKIKRPKIPYIKYLLKSILEEAENEPETEQRTEKVGQ